MIQREIAERLAVEGPSVVRQIGLLEAAGRIERLPLTSDRRAAVIRLTAAGEALFDEVYGSILTTETALTDGISEADVATALPRHPGPPSVVEVGRGWLPRWTGMRSGLRSASC